MNIAFDISPFLAFFTRPKCAVSKHAHTHTNTHICSDSDEQQHLHSYTPMRCKFHCLCSCLFEFKSTSFSFIMFVCFCITIQQWKTELEEVIEAATLDSELWVSMIAETIKTFPNTGSLNTEISDYEETRPIFIEMVNDLKKYVNKHSDLGMLPLECQYLNKMALASVVCIRTNRSFFFRSIDHQQTH